MLAPKILVRVALVALLLTGLVALVDVMARAQLADALAGLPDAGARAVTQVAGAGD